VKNSLRLKRPISALRAVSIFLIVGASAFQAPGQIPAAQESGVRQVFIVPFSHLDLFWACTREECLSRGNFIIRRAVQLARKYPAYRFLLESEIFVANFVESNRGTPELDEFKHLVAEGRIEIAPLWAGIYQNQTPDEALVRNLLIGKRYARETFGVDPKVANLTDIPGFTLQYPQILAKSGTPYTVLTRMGPRDVSLFHWESPDGSSVLAWNTINGYGWGVGLRLHQDLTADRANSVASDISSIAATTRGPIFLGWGTDLFAPNETLIKNVAVLNDKLPSLRFRLSTSEEFFNAAQRTDRIPELQGEIPSSWANLTTSLLPLWPSAVEATRTLVTAEKFAAVTYALGYSDYPSKLLEELWRLDLQSLDHNNDGQGGAIGDERKLGYAREAELGAGRILRDSLRDITERVKHTCSRCVPIVVFNPLNWMRDDAVEAHVTLFGEVETPDIDDYKAGMKLLDSDGISIPFEVADSTDGSSRSVDVIFVARNVPSIGYKTYYLVPSAEKITPPKATAVKIETDEDVKNKDNDSMGEDTLETEFYRIAIDRTTGRIEVFDKASQRFVTKGMEIIGTEEKGGDDQNIILRSDRHIVNVVDSIEVEEDSSVRTVVRIRGNVGKTPVDQSITLWRGVKKIDLRNTIHWTPGPSVSIEQIFPIVEPHSVVRNGVPFGSIATTDIMKGSGPSRDDEVSPDIWQHWRQIQDWVFFGTKEFGVTISADHPLIEVNENQINAEMLRGTRFNPTTTTKDGRIVMDLRPPAGSYVFSYSMTSARGNWSDAKSWRAGLSFRTPLIPVASAESLSAGILPPQQSFLSLDQDNVVVTAMKKEDAGAGVILRAVEMTGSPVEVTPKFLGRVSKIEAVNLLETRTSMPSHTTVHLAPFEIETLKLNLP
jgi:hypothetical protein